MWKNIYEITSNMMACGDKNLPVKHFVLRQSVLPGDSLFSLFAKNRCLSISLVGLQEGLIKYSVCLSVMSDIGCGLRE